MKTTLLQSAAYQLRVDKNKNYSVEPRCNSEGTLRLITRNFSEALEYYLMITSAQKRTR